MRCIVLALQPFLGIQQTVLDFNISCLYNSTVVSSLSVFIAAVFSRFYFMCSVCVYKKRGNYDEIMITYTQADCSEHCMFFVPKGSLELKNILVIAFRLLV